MERFAVSTVVRDTERMARRLVSTWKPREFVRL
jgi:hypothetical protein